MSQLHANIQDVFNEYGVQIMSPHYIADPPEPFVDRQLQKAKPPYLPKDTSRNNQSAPCRPYLWLLRNPIKHKFCNTWY